MGETQFALSQNNPATANPGNFNATGPKAIPGFYNPATGEFTTHVASSATPQSDAQAALTGTSLFFREDFQIKIWNYDQSTSAQVSCTASIETADTNGVFEDSYTVPAVLSGQNWTCDVPVLTLWTLQNPGADAMSAVVSVEINGVSSGTGPARVSTQSFSLTVPGNTQTVVNSMIFQI